MGTHRSRRGLSEQEQTLWQRFTRAVVPLKARPVATVPEADAKPKAKSKATLAGQGTHASVARPARKLMPDTAPTLAPLGRRQRQRLARGSLEIDGRIDLHGKTQRQAHAALLRFLQAAHRDGARYVLVITGKGARASDDWSERGVLKRQVPLWLAQPEFRAIVVGFEDAHVGHGGEGALYVQVRRAGRR
jgi:DNA-nicking Smr family endonuclease